MNNSSPRSSPILQLTTLFGLYFIFTFWKTKPRPLSKFFFCCLRKPKNHDSLHEKKADTESKKSRDTSSYDLIDGYPQSVTMRVKRNCELPPVPKTAQAPQALNDDDWSGSLQKPKSPLPQPMAIHSTIGIRGWFQPLAACGDEGRPYSYCGYPGSETDPLYATVGGGAGGGGGNPNSELLSPSSTGRQRPNSEPEDELAGVVMTSVDGHHHIVNCGLAQDYALCAGKCDSETGEDSYGGSVVPYYSTIVHDDNNVALEQDEPALPTSNQGVYALVGSNKPVPPDLSIAGPPVPVRSYDTRDVERLLNKRRPHSMGEELRDNYPRPLSGALLSLATAANLGDERMTGVVRRRLHLPGQHRLSYSHRIAQISNNAGITQGALIARGNAADTQLGSFLNRSHDGEQNISAGKDKYRGITTREPLGSLQARNSLSTFISDPKFQLASDALYESVNLYSEVRRDSGNPCESASHIFTSPYRPDQVDSSSLNNVAGLPLEPVSDPYTEISDMPPPDYIGELPAITSSSTRAQKTRALTVSDSDVTDIYARPSPTEVERKFLSSDQQQPNVARILLEMQKFRYVDSETDLSRSITTSSLDRDLCTGSSRSLNEIDPLNPPATPPMTSTVHNNTGVQNSPGTFEPTVHQKPSSSSTAHTSRANSQFFTVVPAFDGSKMTPLMERSIEESTTTASQVHSNHPSAEPSVWSGCGGEPSGASSLCSVSENACSNVDDPEAVEDGELFDQIPLWPSDENWSSVFEYRNPLAR